MSIKSFVKSSIKLFVFQSYDVYISQMRTEISEPDAEAVRNGGVQPVIRHPGDAESRRKQQQQQQRSEAAEEAVASPVTNEGA